MRWAWRWVRSPRASFFAAKTTPVATTRLCSSSPRATCGWTKKVQAIACADGGKLGRADAEFVKARTGFSIGGVSPLAHTTAPVTLIDRELFRFATIWAAAGHPHGVFRLTPAELQALTSAPVHDVTESFPA